MALPDIYVLRHGETEWNAEDRMQGWLDSPLTERGEEQARAQGRLLRTHGIDQAPAYCSTLGRTRHTAEIALRDHRVPIQFDHRLREINVGSLQGQVRAEAKRTHPKLFREDDWLSWYDNAPGGEHFAGLESRCRAFLSDIEDMSEPVVIVTHGITSRMIRAMALGLTAADMGDLPGGQGIIHSVCDGRHETLSDDSQGRATLWTKARAAG